MANQRAVAGFPFAIYANETATSQRIAPGSYIDETSGSAANSGAAAWTEGQDTLAATGTVDVAGAAAWTEAQDAWTATGTITLPAITGVAAWTEAQDGFSAIGNNGAVGDSNDPGLRKRQLEEEARRKTHFDAERDKRAAQRQQIFDAYERIVEGKVVVPSAIADEIKTAVEARGVPDPAIFDFQALVNAAAQVQQLWDDYLERDDEEVLTLL